MNDIKNRFNQPTFNLLSKKILDWGTHLEQNRKNIRLTKKGYFIADEITKIVDLFIFCFSPYFKILNI